ncbi:hypothetical protein ACFQE1_10155 [Halobium palmae]|uniref:Transglycosylase associated protein n=1 Tax=Halobium palmae TaxID=1776492 RepID=A0ABD5RZF1_9EURY
MASVGKSLIVGLAIGAGWFLGNIFLGGASFESALTGEGIAVSGAIFAGLVGAVATLLFR